MSTQADDVGILGLAATHGGTSLGVLTEFGFTPAIETTDIFTVANGKRELLRRIVTQVTLTMTFTTLSILNNAVTALFAGGANGAMTFEAKDGALVVTRKNAETGRPQQVINVPKAAIRGTGMVGTPGSEAAGYQFEAVALLEGAATDLGTIINGAPAAIEEQLRQLAVKQAVAEGRVTTNEVEIDLATISADDARAKVSSGDLPAQAMLDYERENKKRPGLMKFLEGKAAEQQAEADARAAASAEAEVEAE